MPEPALTCVLLADDLTGACDAGVQFAACGFSTTVRLQRPDETVALERVCAGDADVLSLSTESRALAPECLPAIFAAAAQSLPESRVIFKKIDSTLRGNVGAEVALAAEAFECDAAIITPAFPAMRRTVVEGVLRVRDAASIEMAGYWRAQKLEGCLHHGCADLAGSLAAGTRYISLDAGCDEDLDSIAAASLASRRRILWAGSAGLAGALARALRRGPAPAAPRGRTGMSPVLFCIGSHHAVTVEQERKLLEERISTPLNAESAEPREVVRAIGSGRHVALRIPLGRVSTERLGVLIGDVDAPIGATGGDTASLVWRALGVDQLRLRTEISPGIPLGAIHGGRRDGAPLVTKSGGFGCAGALIEVADHFCSV